MKNKTQKSLRVNTARILLTILLVCISCSNCLSAQECSGVLDCAEERVGQEPQVSLSEVLCDSYKKLGVTAADVPSAIQNCEQYRHVLPLIKEINSPEIQGLYSQLSGAIEDAGLSASVESIMEKADGFDAEGYFKRLLPPSE